MTLKSLKSKLAKKSFTYFFNALLMHFVDEFPSKPVSEYSERRKFQGDCGNILLLLPFHEMTSCEQISRHALALHKAFNVQQELGRS